MKFRILSVMIALPLAANMHAEGFLDGIIAFCKGKETKQKPKKDEKTQIDDDYFVEPENNSVVVAELQNGKKIYKSQVDELLAKSGALAKGEKKPEMFLQFAKYLVVQAVAEQKALQRPLSQDTKRKIAESKRNIVVEAYMRDALEHYAYDENKLQEAYQIYSSQIKKANMKEYKMCILALKPEESEAALSSIKNIADFKAACKTKNIPFDFDKYFNQIEVQALFGPDVLKAVQKLKHGEFTKTPIKVRDVHVLVALEDSRQHLPKEMSAIKEELRNAVLLTEYAKLEEQLFQEAQAVIYNENGVRISNEELKKLNDDLKRELAKALNPASSPDKPEDA